MPGSISVYRARCALIALLSLLLAACLLAPGKFVSSLDVRKDGTFAFAYAGEIHMLALSKLAEIGQDKAAAVPGEPASTAEKRRRDAETMRVILGGIDPASPRAAEELAQRLRRQAGWRRVTYKGDGLFDVDFAISGRLDHDFAFPTIERLPMANAFVQVALRNDGTVRVDAPGFAQAAGGEPYRGLLQGFAGQAGAGREGGSPFPLAEGSFTIRTDGAILANNTDEGPQPDPAGQKLAWAVNARTPAAPTALIRLERR
jgi:hypothetical protein